MSSVHMYMMRDSNGGIGYGDIMGMRYSQMLDYHNELVKIINSENAKIKNMGK